MDNTQDISPEEWERIEQYLMNCMEVTERQAFETQLAADRDLQTKVNTVQLTTTGVSEAVLRSQLDAFHRGFPAEEKEFRIRRKTSAPRTWLIAASIFLLAGVGGWLLLNQQSKEEKLFAAYFKPDPGLITAMSATDNYAFEKAMIDYKQGNYTAAIQVWDSLQKGQPTNDTLHYFLGVAQLANGNSNEAAIRLQQVTAQPESFFKEDAYWYLALALINEGKTAEARAALAQSAHPDKDQLLKKLQ